MSGPYHISFTSNYNAIARVDPARGADVLRCDITLDPERWHDLIAPTLVYVAVPMVLHGLYDTLLKKDMSAWALVVALASFGYLAFQVSRLHGADRQEATAAMLREYKRRRKALS